MDKSFVSVMWCRYLFPGNSFRVSMLNSAQRLTFVSDWVCVALHLVMFVVLAAAPVLQFLHLSLSVMHVEKSVFRAEWENSPPEVSACSSAYVYQWLMTAPLHWQTRQQQKHQKRRQKRRGGICKKARNKKATVQVSRSWLFWRLVGMIENKRKQRIEREGAREGECRARPGLEACLCLCLGLIDFPENCCSQPLPWSLMKPSGICHPTTQPTPALHCSSLPPSSFPTHSCWDKHTHSITNKHTHAYTEKWLHG